MWPCASMKRPFSGSGPLQLNGTKVTRLSSNSSSPSGSTRKKSATEPSGNRRFWVCVGNEMATESLPALPGMLSR